MKLCLGLRKGRFAFILLFTIISGCSKDTGPDPDPPGNQEPLRVVQSIYTYEENGTFVNDTANFFYDDEGRVTSKTHPRGSLETYTYNGDSLVSIIRGDLEVLRVPVNVKQDTFTVDFIQYGGFTDTVQLTYIFRNNMQTEFWTYLHLLDPCCSSGRHLQKERDYYNASGNLIKTTIETPPQFIEGDRYT